jgi:hypothetical protein
VEVATRAAAVVAVIAHVTRRAGRRRWALAVSHSAHVARSRRWERRYAITLQPIRTRLRPEAPRTFPTRAATHGWPRRRERRPVVVTFAIKPRARGRHRRHRPPKRARPIPTTSPHPRRWRFIAADPVRLSAPARRAAEGACPSAHVPPRHRRTVGAASAAAAAAIAAISTIPRTTLLCARTIVIAVVVVVVTRIGSTVAAGPLTMCPILAARWRRRRAAAAAAPLGDGHPRHAQRQPCGQQNRFPHAHRNHLVLGASPAFAKLEPAALRLREDIPDVE